MLEQELEHVEFYDFELLEMPTGEIVDIILRILRIDKDWLMEEEIQLLKEAIEDFKKRLAQLTFSTKYEVSKVDAIDALREIASCATAKTSDCSIRKFHYLVTLVTWKYWFHLPGETPELYICKAECVAISPSSPEYS